MAEIELEHFGKKGMKWGVRKNSQATGGSSPKLSRRELRKKNKVDRSKFYDEKATRVINTALKKPETLISLDHGAGYPTVVTGKEFTNYLSRGGAFNVRTTDVFATKSGAGPYVKNTKMNEPFKKAKQ